MQCLSPLSIPRPDGNGNSDRITVPCGRCVACLSTKRNQWSFRLESELRDHSSAFFVTMTYDDNNLPLSSSGYPSVKKKDIQDFLKRLRFNIRPTRIRYYITAEYGPQTLRPHYHGIIFGIDLPKTEAEDVIMKSWQKGHVYIGNVTPASIAYCTKYCITSQESIHDGLEDPFSLMSTKPGLGANYLRTHREFHDNPDRNYCVRPGGVKVALPRYYSDRLYSPETREHRKRDFKPLLDHEEFFRTNPSGNPFKYEIELKNDYIRRVHANLDKLNKL